jgi:hypothetical protein
VLECITCLRLAGRELPCADGQGVLAASRPGKYHGAGVHVTIHQKNAILRAGTDPGYGQGFLRPEGGVEGSGRPPQTEPPEIFENFSRRHSDETYRLRRLDLYEAGSIGGADSTLCGSGRHFR